VLVVGWQPSHQVSVGLTSRRTPNAKDIILDCDADAGQPADRVETAAQTDGRRLIAACFASNHSVIINQLSITVTIGKRPS
jgi:hypothetical protein